MTEFQTTDIAEGIISRLRANGGRITAKRRRVLEALLSFDRPASAEDIRTRAELPESDLVTVYRNLEAIDSVGALQRIPMENGTHLFELTAFSPSDLSSLPPCGTDRFLRRRANGPPGKGEGILQDRACNGGLRPL